MSGNQELKQSQKDVPNVKAPTGKGKGKLRRTNLTQERVHELLDYDISTGFLFWKVKPNWRFKIGTRAGNLNKTYGYRNIKVDGIDYQEHRIVWLHVNGYMPEHGIDHINRVKDDNRIENLREETQMCNARNSNMKSTNSSGVSGVCTYTWFSKRGGVTKQRWSCRVTVGGRKVCIGGFSDMIEAVACRLAVEECIGWDKHDTKSSAYQYMQKYLKGGI